MELRESIIEIIAKVSNVGKAKELLAEDDNLSVANIDSVSFIKMVLLIETKYDIEFDDEQLDFEDFKTVTSLCEYVEKVLKENE